MKTAIYSENPHKEMQLRWIYCNINHQSMKNTTLCTILYKFMAHRILNGCVNSSVCGIDPSRPAWCRCLKRKHEDRQKTLKPATVLHSQRTPDHHSNTTSIALLFLLFNDRLLDLKHLPYAHLWTKTRDHVKFLELTKLKKQ